METTLFWIGLGMAAYALLLRKIARWEGWMEHPAVASLLHAISVATGGAMLGFILSAATDLQGPTPRWPVTGAVLGLLWALGQVFLQRRRRQSFRPLLENDLEWADTCFSAVLLASLIMYAVVQAFKIPSGSMKDTLLIGDHLFVNKFIYGIRVPFTEKRVLKIRKVRRGDIIVFQCPPDALSTAERERGVRKDFIKRAVAVGGDEVIIRDKRLFVNGQLQAESYAVAKDPFVYPAGPLLIKPAELQTAWESGALTQTRGGMVVRDNFGPVKIPDNCYFVMGDNRDESFDSRFWGPLPDRLLKGRAWVVYFPFKRWRVIR